MLIESGGGKRDTELVGGDVTKMSGLSLSRSSEGNGGTSKRQEYEFKGTTETSNELTGSRESIVNDLPKPANNAN